MDDVFLTTEEVLEYLQVNLRTVYRLIKAGKIPAVRVGRQWRFRKRDIDAWLDSQHPRGGLRSVSPQVTRPTTAASRPRVLVVDDESSIRDLLAKTLALAEYDVDVAPDGRSAYLLLSDPVRAVRQVDAIDLQSFLVQAVSVGSPPVAVGVVPATSRVFVAQSHQLGRVSFIDLETLALKTVTGFELNNYIIE